VLRSAAVGERVEHAAGAEHATQLGDARRYVRHVVQHVHRHHGVERAVREGQRLHVATDARCGIDAEQPAVRDVERDKLTSECRCRGDVRPGAAAGVEDASPAQRGQRVRQPCAEIDLRLTKLVDRRSWPRGHGGDLVVLAIVDAPAGHGCSLARFAGPVHGNSPSPMAAAESEKSRIDRELIELLNELRVALPGVQVLFAFLLTLPFMPTFDKISDVDRRWYFVSIVLTALSSMFLIAPSAHHRIRFRDRAKEQLLKAASAYAVIGLALLAGAMSTTLFLVTDVLYDSTVASITAGSLGLATAVFWFLVPFLYRSEDDS
jgi:hypothetical protein